MEKGQKNARTDKIADWPFFLHFFPFLEQLYTLHSPTQMYDS